MRLTLWAGGPTRSDPVVGRTDSVLGVAGGQSGNGPSSVEHSSLFFADFTSQMSHAPPSGEGVCKGVVKSLPTHQGMAKIKKKKIITKHGSRRHNTPGDDSSYREALTKQI